LKEYEGSPLFRPTNQLPKTNLQKRQIERHMMTFSEGTKDLPAQKCPFCMPNSLAQIQEDPVLQPKLLCPEEESPVKLNVYIKARPLSNIKMPI
jgi:hypothetical protein